MAERVVDLRLVKPSADPEVVALARELLQRCESGEIAGFCAAIDYADGSYGTLATATRSDTRDAGILLSAAVRRLGYRPADDE